MISTIGEAYDHGWKVTVRCAWGRREGMKTIRDCPDYVELDLRTLIWTRGRDFPLDLLGSRMKCMRCGSRRVRVLFHPPATGSAARVAG
jgi:hypothetical protein